MKNTQETHEKHSCLRAVVDGIHFPSRTVLSMLKNQVFTVSLPDGLNDLFVVSPAKGLVESDVQAVGFTTTPGLYTL